jgi:hypothetical protein
MDAEKLRIMSCVLCASSATFAMKRLFPYVTPKVIPLAVTSRYSGPLGSTSTLPFRPPCWARTNAGLMSSIG